MLINILFLLSSAAFLTLLSTDSRAAVETVFLFILVFLFNRKYRLTELAFKKTGKKAFALYAVISAVVCVPVCLGFYKAISDRIPLPAPLMAAGVAVAGVLSLFSLTVIMAAAKVFLSPLFCREPSLLAPDDIPLPDGTVRICRITAVIVLVLLTGFMLRFASSQSFWYDELDYTIGKVAGKTFSEISIQLLKDGYNMPLYYYALALIYPLVPYGEVWLLSIGIAAVIAGIVILSRAAERLGGKTLGIITLVFASSTAALITQGAWECRPYAFYFCFSALTVLMYIKRIQNETMGNIVGLSIAMILLVYSHWFGAVLLVFYGICDLILCIKKRIHIKCIVSYILTAAALIPWFVLMLMMHTIDLGSYWGGSPRFLSLLAAYKWLLGTNNLCVLALIIGVLLVIALWVHAARSRKWSAPVYLWVQTLLCCIWMPGITFIYSKFINPGGGVFERRYFFALVPHLCLISALGLYGIGKMLSKSGDTLPSLRPARVFMLFMAGAVISCCWFALGNITSIKEPFREASERISSDESIFSGNTLVISSSAGAAWTEYYFGKRGTGIPSNMIDGYASPFTVIIKDGSLTDTAEEVDYSYILGYDRVWYSYANYRRDDDLRDFLGENYTLSDEDKKSRTALYIK